MKFSVVVAAYNVAEYLDKCLESIVAQDFPKGEYEVLVVDDGSTDQLTSKICDSWAEKHEVVKAIHQENGGLSAARNTGIKHSVGDYLLFVDGDDFWNNDNFLFSLSYHIDEKKSDIVIFPYDKFYSDDDVVRVDYKTLPKSGKINDDVIELVNKGALLVPAWNKCVKKEFFEAGLNFPLDFLSEDCLYCANLIKQVTTYSILDIECYKYRQNRPGSITNIVKEKNALDILKSIDIGLQNKQSLNVTIQSALNNYFAISYISILPYVLPYKSNPEIDKLLKEYKYLLQYAKDLADKKFKYTGVFTSLFGLSFSTRFFSYLLRYYK